MLGSHGRKVVAGAAALLAVSGGAAAAATGALGPREESDAVLSDAAERLGVEPPELREALTEALKSRIDEAVAAGRLGEEDGEALKSRIDSDDYPLLGLPPAGADHHVRLGPFGGLDAAASYLGLTEAELDEALADGKTLAGVASEEGKSVDGLVDAMVAAAAEDLGRAVEAGRLTEERMESLLSGLEKGITDLVNGRLPAVREHAPPSGPPPAASPSTDASAA